MVKEIQDQTSFQLHLFNIRKSARKVYPSYVFKRSQGISCTSKPITLWGVYFMVNRPIQPDLNCSRYHVTGTISKQNRTHNEFLIQTGSYGDAKSAIRKAMLQAAKEMPGLDGHVFTIQDKNEIIGAAMVNRTGMGDIPENILAYIAIYDDYRSREIENTS